MTDLTPDAPEPATFATPYAEPVPPSPPAPTGLSHVLYGADGLRAGWGLLTFILLFIAISFGTAYTAAKIRHKPFGPAAQKAADTEKAKSQPAATDAARSASKESTPKSLFISEGVSVVVVLLITFLMGRIERRPFGAFGLGGTRPIAHFLQGLVWGAVCLSLLVLTLHLGGYLSFDARLLPTPAALRFSLIWALGFTLVALLEENLLRGYLQYTLARGLAGIYGAIFQTRHRHALGFWTAALFLSFVFGLGHGSNPGESPIGLLSAGTAGLVFCFALYRTGSLWWALGAHASWDWAQSFLYGVADSGTMVQGHLYATHPVGKPILSGGLTGPEGSIFVLVALALLAAIIFFTLPQTHRPGAGLAHPDTP